MRRHLDYWRAGYKRNILPIIPPDAETDIKGKGKAPGYRDADSIWHGYLGWQKDKAVSRKKATRWQDMGASVGLKCGMEGMTGLDADITDDLLAAAVDDAMTKAFGTLMTRRVDHPKHVKFLKAFQLVDSITAEPIEDFPNFDYAFTQPNGEIGKIQLISRGRQFVADGLHATRRREYVWDIHPTEEPLPLVTREDLQAFLEAVPNLLRGLGCDPLSNRSTSGVKHGRFPTHMPVEEVRHLLSMIPNDDAFDYDTYVKMGFAVFGATGGSVEGQEAFTEWAGQKTFDDPTNPPERLWDTIDPENAHAGGCELRGFAQERDPQRLAREDFGKLDVDPDKDMLEDLMEVGRGVADDIIKGSWYWTAGPKPVFYHVRNMLPLTKDAFNDENSRHLRFVRKFYKMASKSQLVSKYFFEHSPNLTHVADVEPDKDRVFVRGNGEKVLNVWTPYTIWQGDIDPQVIETYYTHCVNVLGSKEAADLWIKWNAFCLQYPSIKMGWHFLVLSKSGFGKDMMLGPIVAAHGKNTEAINTGLLKKEFNTYLYKRLVTCSEMEAVSRDKDIYTKLKSFTSSQGERIPIEGKNANSVMIRNITSFVLFSNEAVPLHISAGERRFYVIDRLDTDPQPQTYFDRIGPMFDLTINPNNVGMIGAYLHRYPLSQEDKLIMRRDAPHSKDKERLIEEGAPDHIKHLKEIREEVSNGSTRFRPYATAEEMQKWLKEHFSYVTKTPGWRDLWDVGMRPVNPKKDNPKQASVLRVDKGTAKLWRVADTWRDAKDNFVNLENLPPAAAVRLYKQGRMGVPIFGAPDIDDADEDIPAN